MQLRPRPDPGTAEASESPASEPFPCADWRFVILAEIRNFAALRRHFGRKRSNDIAGDVVARIQALGLAAESAPIGQAMIEIRFEGARPTLLNEVQATIRQACSNAFVIDGERQHVDLVYGVAAAPRHHADEIAMIEEAETALAQARASSALYTADPMERASEADSRLTEELDRAIENGDLILQYQPKVHVRRQHISSAEALVRWRHSERGLIPPNDFIPAAERSRLICKLTLWTLRQAIADQRTLALGGNDLRLFVNVSGQVLGDLGFVEQVRQMVVAGDAKIGFEITETAVIRDPEVAIRSLQTFADLGITIAIDDYGAGLSSLAYLKKLPARELKIDKLFVTQLTSSNRDPLIVRSTIDLAHALDMEVVAEGVETHAALALLMVMGCDMVQGYLISRPIGLDALVRFLAEERNHAAPQETRASFLRLASAWKQA